MSARLSKSALVERDLDLLQELARDNLVHVLVSVTTLDDELKRRILTEPKLASHPMVQAALAGDFARLLEGEHFDVLMQVLSFPHAGITIDEFRDAEVRDLHAA